jgi:hypothetical protein
MKKLSGYVFRRIGGKIIPIRANKVAETLAAGEKGYSKGAFRKLKLLLKSHEVKLTKAGNIRKWPERSGTEAMNEFMKKTGSVRVSKNGSTLSIDPETKLTNAQFSTLKDMSHGVKDFYINNDSSRNINSLIHKVTKNKPKTPYTKLADKLDGKAIKEYGVTHNPNVAGYINRKGDMLNFSGGGGNERYLDHRDVSGLVPSRLKKITDKDISRILHKEQSYRKRQVGKNHAHWKYLENIKKLQKVDFIRGKDRGELIKDNIRYIPKDKLHLLKRLKKARE